LLSFWPLSRLACIANKQALKTIFQHFVSLFTEKPNRKEKKITKSEGGRNNITLYFELFQVEPIPKFA